MNKAAVGAVYWSTIHQTQTVLQFVPSSAQLSPHVVPATHALTVSSTEHSAMSVEKYLHDWICFFQILEAKRYLVVLFQTQSKVSESYRPN